MKRKYLLSLIPALTVSLAHGADAGDPSSAEGGEPRAPVRLEDGGEICFPTRGGKPLPGYERLLFYAWDAEEQVRKGELRFPGEESIIKIDFQCIGSVGAKNIAENLERVPVKDLELHVAETDPVEMEVMLGALAVRKTVTKLGLFSSQITPAMATVIAASLGKLPQVTKLWLDLRSGDGEIDAESMAILSGAITAMPGVVDFRFRFSGLTDASAPAVAALVQGMPALTDLSLHENAFGVEGARIIAEALSAMPKLRKLDFGGQPIGDEGAMAVTTAVAAHEGFNQLHLWWNGYSAETLAAIREIFAGRKMEKLELSVGAREDAWDSGSPTVGAKAE